jgi:urease accessory protein
MRMMATTTRTITTIDPAVAGPLLALMQLSDSALPIGRHAHAMGLERLFRDGRVQTPASLREMIVSALLQGSARADGAATALAHDALKAGDAHALKSVDAQLDLLKQTPSAQAASRRCGSRLAVLATTFSTEAVLMDYVAAVADKATPGHLAVVSGAISAAAGVSRAHAVLTEMRGVAAMILSAAVRLDVLPSRASQDMLAALSPEIIAAAGIAMQTIQQDMECSAAAGLEIAAMRHARHDGRLFAT